MVAVEGALLAEASGLRMCIEGRGDVLTCRLAGDPGNLPETLRRSRSLLTLLRLIIPVLVRSGIGLEVVAGSVRVGRFGSGVKQNALARLLRLPSSHVGA